MVHNFRLKVILLITWTAGSLQMTPRPIRVDVRESLLRVHKMAKDTSATAEEFIKRITDDFNMNVNFQLRKIGVTRDQLRRIGIENDLGANNTRKCFGPLGCLEVSEKWYGLTRPVNLLPESRDIINTRFVLRTRSTLDKPTFLNVSDPLAVRNSAYNGTKPTILIVHGFLDTAFVPWVEEMSSKLLLVNDVNAIAVDWGGGSAAMYSQSAANTRLVGLEISYLIRYLAESHGSKMEDFHIIGHSLGSHIAGYTGEHIFKTTGQKIGRISGLDPAEPLFELMPDFVRLDPSDAIFVDALHTDAKSILMFGYGMIEPVGHVDFYPNGGTRQPGCSILDVPFSLETINESDTYKTADSIGRHMVACSHSRAIQLYIESLEAIANYVNETSHPCVQVGFECASYLKFKEGSCLSCGERGWNCAKPGYSAIEYKAISEQREETNVKFYYNTGSFYPFCQHHYLVDLQLANPKEAERWVQGSLMVNLYGSHGEVTDHSLTPENSVKLVHGSGKKFVLSFSQDLGTIALANLKWMYDHIIDPLDPFKVCVFMCTDVLYVSNLTVTGVQANPKSPKIRTEVLTVCGDPLEDGSASVVRSGYWKMFYKDC